MKKVYALRTLIKKEIVTEFVPPVRKSNKVVIVCGGLPSYPSRDLLFLLASKGYWAFFPRYRGSWESGGRLLKKSPHLDIIDVMDAVSSGFTDLWDNKKYRLKNPSFYILGGSFGGPAAILSSLDKRVKSAVVFSPVIDWQAQAKSPIEPLDRLGKFIRPAFGEGYRFSDKDWAKLGTGRFYSPLAVLDKLDKKKIYIIHAQDDEIVPAAPSIGFAKALGCKLTVLKKGGHLSLFNNLRRAAIWKRVRPFLR